MAFFDIFRRQTNKTAQEQQQEQQTLNTGLEKSKESVISKLSHAIVGKSTVDDDVLDNLEEALITSDVGVETTLRIIERIQKRVAKDKYIGTSELNRILMEETCALLNENQIQEENGSDNLNENGEKIYCNTCRIS